MSSRRFLSAREGLSSHLLPGSGTQLLRLAKCTGAQTLMLAKGTGQHLKLAAMHTRLYLLIVSTLDVQWPDTISYAFRALAWAWSPASPETMSID
ncbi:hypothetical protein OEZ85_005436 [Tetradesmus obliquus]|uniref:Uncharacterized protein n=1 Tax=Tetradesmus obliquus TaxID=3088 RepID=A0ABY8ULJ3_TETOB|nr:hypothetical protein OEZ85_005436 [Tetradesmus obliquus]